MAIHTPLKTIIGAGGSVSAGLDRTHGYVFTSNVNGNIVGLGGKRTNNSVKLWRKSDSALLATTSFTWGGTNWEYATLASPVAITAGVEYIVGIYHPSSAYRDWTTGGGGDGDITIVSGIQSTGDVVPNSDTGGTIRGFADIQFEPAGADVGENPIIDWATGLGAPITSGPLPYTMGTKFVPSVAGFVTSLACRRYPIALHLLQPR